MPQPARTLPSKRDWLSIVSRYQRPSAKLAVGQLANTFLPFVVLWYLAWRSLAVSYGLTLLLSAIAAGLLVRVFIFQHDCGHGSFLPSRRWNDLVGHVCSLVTITPYIAWRHDHAIHHASAGNLDHRGTGDIMTLTIAEYRAKPWWSRLYYRMYRQPLLMFSIGPLLYFVLEQRLWFRYPQAVRPNIHLTNLGLALLYVSLGLLVGWRALLLIQIPIVLLSSSAGVFLFYVQHQFEDAYWARAEGWDYAAVALQGSSYLRLPRWLQWLTGNIGFHHIHHLSPRIPNYRLQQCHDENPLLQDVPTITLRDTLQTLPLALWDEDRGRLIPFSELAA